MTSNAAHPTTARVLTPQSKSDPNDVKVEEIPLPPADQWEALDNSGAQQDAGSSVERPVGSREIEKLDFDKPIARAVPLEFAFTHADLGRVTSITVRRLTVGEVGTILDSRAKDAPDLFDVYAEMTGVPAPVLRGLISVDGDEVAAACWDFLPRYFRGGN